MAVSIGPRIQVDGEEQYRKQINEIIQQAKTLDAEMDALTASFADNATAEEKAAASSKNLNEQLELAKKRTDLVRQMTEKAATATGENSTQTLKWRQALASAEEQQHKLEKAVKENTEILEKQGDAFTGLGDQLDGIAGKLGISIPDAAKDALNGMEGFSSGSIVAMGAVTGAITLAVSAAKKLGEVTKDAAKDADALLTRSAQTGLSTELLQQLDYAQKFLDFEGIDQTLVKMTASMDKARDGAEKQSKAFEALGVSVTGTDGQLRDNWETFLDVIDALGKVENATERDAFANDLFGKSYSEMKPLIDAGTGALQDYMNAAVENGYVMEREQIQKLGEVDDAIQENESRWKALKDMIAVEYADAYIATMNTTATMAETAARAVMDSGLLSAFSDLVENTANLFTNTMNIYEKLPDWMNPLKGLAADLEFIATLIEKIDDGVNWLFSGEALEEVRAAGTTGGGMGFSELFNRNESATPAAAETIGDTIGKRVTDYFDKIDVKPIVQYDRIITQDTEYNAAGTDYFRGGMTWVGESGPELVALPQGSRIYSNAESERMTEPADNSAVVALLERNVALLERIEGEFSGLRVKGRMA